ncbi:hypothetical protein B0F90DRAFT_1736557, partial [Multifurca ochricompacta]
SPPLSSPSSHRHHHHYIHFSISPPCSDPLLIRRTLQQALSQSFGITLSHIYLDVLWVANSGSQCVIRANDPNDAASVMAAAAVFNGSPHLSTLNESNFLPSISGEEEKSRKIF